MALVRRVLDVGLAAALAEAALVERQHAVPRVQPLLERRRVRGPRAAPAVAVHDHRHPVLAVGAGRAEERVADLHRRRCVPGSGTLVEAAVGDRGGRRGRGWRGARRSASSRAATTAPTTAPRRGAMRITSCPYQPRRTAIWSRARLASGSWARGTPSSRATTSRCSPRSTPASVDLVYIDPPYNTGNDFAYRDDFRHGAGSGSRVDPARRLGGDDAAAAARRPAGAPRHRRDLRQHRRQRGRAPAAADGRGVRRGRLRRPDRGEPQRQGTPARQGLRDQPRVRPRLRHRPGPVRARREQPGRRRRA